MVVLTRDFDCLVVGFAMGDSIVEVLSIDSRPLLLGGAATFTADFLEGTEVRLVLEGC